MKITKISKSKFLLNYRNSSCCTISHLFFTCIYIPISRIYYNAFPHCSHIFDGSQLDAMYINSKFSGVCRVGG